MTWSKEIQNRAEELCKIQEKNAIKHNGQGFSVVETKELKEFLRILSPALERIRELEASIKILERNECPSCRGKGWSGESRCLVCIDYGGKGRIEP